MHLISNQGDRPRVAIVQDSARLHYALPLALQRAGILERMYTDLFSTQRSALSVASRVLAKLKPGLGRPIAGRRCDELEPARVSSNPWITLRYHRRRPSDPVPASFWIWSCEQISDWVRRIGLGEANALMGFINSIHPSLLSYARQRGLVTVGDQMIAPIGVELKEATLQKSRFEGWEPSYSLEELRNLEPFQHETWRQLDHFTCASEYVCRGLVSEGVDASRITVIPYPIELDRSSPVERSRRRVPMTVGFVGAVNLRKGAPYFFEVARRFRPGQIRFVMVGKVGLDKAVADAHRGHVELVGLVPRTEVKRFLSEFDVFLFPSTCEGSAGAVIEAMAAGMPVVASPNSGTFARDGIEGFIRPYDDVDGMTACLESLRDDAELRDRMGHAARARVEQFDVNAYAGRAFEMFSQLLAGSRT